MIPARTDVFTSLCLFKLSQRGRAPRSAVIMPNVSGGKLC